MAGNGFDWVVIVVVVVVVVVVGRGGGGRREEEEGHYYYYPPIQVVGRHGQRRGGKGHQHSEFGNLEERADH